MAKKKKTDGSQVYNIVALCFADRATGQEVAKAVRSEQKLAGYKVVAEAVVEVDAKGKTHIHEPGRGGLGGGIGAAAGGLLGLIGGPAGLLAWAVAGGVVGGIAGHYMGRAIPAKDLEKLGKQMKPDSSAFLALVEDTDTEKVIDEMKGYKANVVTLTIADEASGTVEMAVAADVTVPKQDGSAKESAPAAKTESTKSSTAKSSSAKSDNTKSASAKTADSSASKEKAS
jgi:uncharacterized membrane protein